jgi:hypothetical protein
MNKIYSAVDIRDAAYQVLSTLTEEEYAYAEKLLWALNKQLEKGKE